MKHATVLLLCVLSVLMLLVGIGAAPGDVAGDVAWLTVTLSTPKATTPSKVTPELPTGTPWPTTTHITPTSPPPETVTPGITADPSPSATATPGEPDRKASPTLETTLPVTGGGLPPNVAIGLTAIGMVCLLFVAWAARRARNAVP